MSLIKRAVVVGGAVLALIGAGAGPALAAAPVNDIARRAVPVTVPQSLTQDTTQATTDDTDVKVNLYCGAPATDASVWYTYTPASSGAVIIDVSRSNYSAGVIVTTGGSNGLVACGPTTVLATLTAGTTYYILAFDDQGDGGGNGGTLNIAFLDGGQTPTLNIEVSRNARLDGAGNATVRGSYTCTGSGKVQINGDLLQLRRVAVRGSFGFVESGTCDGSVQTWSAVVSPDSSRFVEGEALVTSFGFGCGRFLCADGYDERVVQIRAPRS